MDINKEVSIIIPVKNEGDNVRTTLNSLFQVRTDVKFEVIVVDDKSTDRCCDFISTYPFKDDIILLRTEGIGAARVRNYGASHASGSIFIFCDAHLQFEDWWIDRLIEPIKNNRSDAVTPAIADMNNKDHIGYGQSLTHKLQIVWNKKRNELFETAVLPGACFAISKEAFNTVGGFDNKFKSWGHEDVELSIKLWLFGYRCHVRPEITIAHLFRSTHPYTVSSFDVNYNFLRMSYLHFNDNRIEKCKRLCRFRNICVLEKQVIEDGVLKQKTEYEKMRKYDDHWYFNKFHIYF